MLPGTQLTLAVAVTHRFTSFWAMTSASLSEVAGLSRRPQLRTPAIDDVIPLMTPSSLDTRCLQIVFLLYSGMLPLSSSA